MSNFVEKPISKQFASIILVSLLTACAAAPTRTDLDSFYILKEGRISPKTAQAFATCLLDGFDKAHFILSNVTHRIQRRDDLFRVESLVGGRLLIISADVFDEGRVVLNESKKAALINTMGQRETFDKCLGQYRFDK